MKNTKQPRIAYTIADNNNLQYANMLENSLRKFHSEKELPFIVIGEDKIKATRDPKFFYRATPIIANDLLKEYETVIKLDSDMIITGDISHVWEGDFDVATVQNGNPMESKAYPVGVWDITPGEYFNCGFVVMKSEKFVDHWAKLCFTRRFDNYQMREQDLLNIMCFYGDYKVRPLDIGEKWHGLVLKGYEPKVILKDDKLILPKGDEWPRDTDKEIVCWHVAGGNVPNKMNYRIRFNKEVAERIKWLVS